MVISLPGWNIPVGFCFKIIIMAKLNKIFTLEITPEQFLMICSPNDLKEIDILLQGNFYQQRMNSQICRICRCTDYDCSQCIAESGEPCYWVEDDLCSACVESDGKVVEYEDHINAIENGSENS